MCLIYTNVQYSSLAAEVHRGRGKVPVADYKIASYVSEEDVESSANLEPKTRSCYSFCMCPGGQVCFFFFSSRFFLLNLDFEVCLFF